MSGKNQSDQVGSVSSDDREIEIRCGYRKCRPEILETCNNSKMMLAIMSLFVFFQAFNVTGLFNVNVSTIERRFQVKSATMGLIASFNDISAAIFGVVVSYFGSGRHKARLLAVSTIFMVVGSILMVLPHFTTGRYEWGESTSKLCNENGNIITGSTSCEPSSLQGYIALFAGSLVMYGLASATLYTVGVAYIDDSVSSVHSPMYIGIFYACAALGPGAGYLIGGLLLNIYVDFERVDTSYLGIDTDDVRWVGAWWLGPAFSIIFFAVTGLALSCFGAELPSAKTVRETRISQLHAGTTTKQEVKIPTRPKLKQVPSVLLALLKNPPFIFLTLAGIVEAMSVFGLLTFIAKYVETAYNVSSSKSALLCGLPILLGLTGGIAFGGFFCRFVQLKVKGMLKFSLIVCFFSAFCAAMMFAICDQQHILGIQASYLNSTSDPSLIAECNSGCECTTEFYLPSCDKHGYQYFSPCHAGCHVSSDDGKNFENCSCIATPQTGTLVTAGKCDTSCKLMYLFLVLLFLFYFTTFAADVPAEQAILRSIDENHRVIMYGMNRFVIRLLGTVPGELIYGAAIDAGCLTWKNGCGEDTSCWIYDIAVVSRNYFIITIVTKVISLMFLFCAFWFYKPPIEMNNDIELDAPATNGVNFINSSFDQTET